MINKLLQNKIISDFSIQEYSSSLTLSDGFCITIGCLVRFLGSNDTFLCAKDHGHKFGLDYPYDAEKTIKELITNKKIQKIEINEKTGDLNLFVESGILQIICDSGGYECYQINGPNNFFLVAHGGIQK